MSLNATEQLLYDYLEKHPDEQRHWREAVVREAGRAADVYAAAAALERALRLYLAERARVAAPFRELAARPGGLGRISLRNLAELLLRLWSPPAVSLARSNLSRSLPLGRAHDAGRLA